MTTITILGGDFEILFDDETVGSNAVAGMRMVRRTAGASDTIYTTNALYSAVADEADAFQAMGFTNPMLPTTPNAYTMENKYFIPRSSTEYLKEGTITANWSLTASPDSNGNGVIAVGYTGGTNFVTGDIGRQVIQADTTDSGTLLDFEVAPDGSLIAWIRPDDSTPSTGDVFDGTGALSVTADGGTGASTSSTAGVAGTTQYTAIQAIGSVPTATEVYVVQDRFKLTSSTGGFQWWATDPTASLGIISVLVRTQYQGTQVADGDLEVFARRYTSLYDNFRLNVAAGGFSALPLASAPDINNTTGYRQLTGSAGSNTFNVGNAIFVGATWATATKKGVITAVGGTTGAPVIEYYLVGDLTDFVASDAIKEYDYVAAGVGDATCTAGAPIVNPGGPTDTTAGEGGTVTVAFGTTTADHDGDGTLEPYSITVDAQGPGGNGVVIAKVYERMKFITRRGATTSDLFGAGVNVPGETYRGLDAQVQYDGAVGTFTEGDDVDISAKPNYSSRVISVNTTDTYVMLTDQQTSLATLADNDVLRDEALDTVTVMGAPDFFTSPKASPFGTFTGSQIFGARGVLFTGQADTDTQAYTLTDDNGVLRTSPNTVTFTVANTVAGDRVLVARDTGVAGVIDKDQFGGMTATAASAKSITVAGTIDSEVAQAGYLRVVETTLQQEHKYVYASRNTSTGVFTLVDITASTATAGTNSTTLVDSTASFVTEGVEVGMLIQDTTNTGTYEVVSVDSETSITMFHLYGADLIASGDAYNINETIQAYTVNDNIYDLILDLEADATSESNTFVKTVSSPFGTVINVRQGKVILPFTQNQTVGDSGATVTVVRQPDTIAV